MTIIDFAPSGCGRYVRINSYDIGYVDHDGSCSHIMRFISPKQAVFLLKESTHVVNFPCAIRDHITRLLNTHFNDRKSFINTNEISRNFCYEVDYRNPYYRGPVAHLVRAYVDNMYVYVPDLHRVLARIAHSHAVDDDDNSKYTVGDCVQIHLCSRHDSATRDYTVRVVKGSVGVVMHDPAFDFGPPLDYILSNLASGGEYSVPGKDIILALSD